MITVMILTFRTYKPGQTVSNSVDPDQTAPSATSVDPDQTVPRGAV